MQIEVQVTIEGGVTVSDRHVLSAIVAEQLVTVASSEGKTFSVASGDGVTTVIEIPAGAVTEPTQLAYSSSTTVTGSPSGFEFAGRAFSLKAYRNEGLLHGLVFEEPITITVHYTEGDVAGLDENTLELRSWNGAEWSGSGITVVERDIARRGLVMQVEHLSSFAIFAREQGETIRERSAHP